MLRRATVFALLSAIAIRAAEREAGDALRVRWIRPSTFDYTLVSVFEGSNDRTILGFNHRSGRSSFVGVGEKLGEYTAVLFLPSTERVFNPTIDAYEEKKSGRAVLRDADGNRIRLQLGVPLEEEGWTACMVSLDDGAEWRIKQGETIRADNMAFRVADITQRELRVTPESGTSRVVPLATDEEIAEVRERLAKSREMRRKAAAQAEQHRTQMKMLKALAGQPLVTRAARKRHRQAGGSTSSRLRTLSNAGATFSFGTDVRYPVEYEVVPRWIYHNGRHIYSPIVVPTRFATRRTGMRLQGTGVNVLSAPY